MENNRAREMLTLLGLHIFIKIQKKRRSKFKRLELHYILLFLGLNSVPPS